MCLRGHAILPGTTILDSLITRVKYVIHTLKQEKGRSPDIPAAMPDVEKASREKPKTSVGRSNQKIRMHILKEYHNRETRLLRAAVKKGIRKHKT
jgi:hypothetical protein